MSHKSQNFKLINLFKIKDMLNDKNLQKKDVKIRTR